MGTTTNLHLPYPEENEPADVPVDMQELANATDAAIQAALTNIAPVGSILMWPTATPPTNWLLCIGQTTVASSAFPLLAALLGEVAPGFIRVPDLRGRVPLGVGVATQPAVPGGSTHTLLQKSGSEQVVLAPAHIAVKGHNHLDTFAVATQPAFNTGTESADHSHAYNDRWGPINRYTLVAAGSNTAENVAWANHIHGAVSTSTGGRSAAHTHSVPAHGHTLNGAVTALADGANGASHENMPPYLALNFMIKAAL